MAFPWKAPEGSSPAYSLVPLPPSACTELGPGPPPAPALFSAHGGKHPQMTGPTAGAPVQGRGGGVSQPDVRGLESKVGARDGLETQEEAAPTAWCQPNPTLHPQATEDGA